MKIAKLRFQTQRSNSKTGRGIDFKLSFDEWYNWWLSNGIDKNTDTRPDLCMCRFKDEGAYSLDNIYLATRSQNIRDGFKNNRHQNKRTDYTGNYKPLKTPDGIFNSRKEAAEYYNVSPESLSYRVKTNPGYSYIDKKE